VGRKVNGRNDATDKTGVNADRANTAGQVDHAPDRSTEPKPARYIAKLLNVGPLDALSGACRVLRRLSKRYALGRFMHDSCGEGISR
jgi:hypothetical protein